MDIVEQALCLMKEDAIKRGENAAQAGERHDGGKRDMLQKVEFFEDGIRYTLDKVRPKWLLGYIAIAKIQNDPEYSEYQRLKEKFE